MVAMIHMLCVPFRVFVSMFLLLAKFVAYEVGGILIDYRPDDQIGANIDSWMIDNNDN